MSTTEVAAMALNSIEPVNRSEMVALTVNAIEPEVTTTEVTTVKVSTIEPVDTSEMVAMTVNTSEPKANTTTVVAMTLCTTDSEVNTSEMAAVTVSASELELNTSEMAAREASTSEPEVNTSEMAAMTARTVEPEVNTTKMAAITASTVEPEVNTSEMAAVTVKTVEPEVNTSEMAAMTASTSEPQVTATEEAPITVTTSEPEMTSTEAAAMALSSAEPVNIPETVALTVNSTQPEVNTTEVAAVIVNTVEPEVNTLEMAAMTASTVEPQVSTTEGAALTVSTTEREVNTTEGAASTVSTNEPEVNTTEMAATTVSTVEPEVNITEVAALTGRCTEPEATFSEEAVTTLSRGAPGMSMAGTAARTSSRSEAGTKNSEATALAVDRGEQEVNNTELAVTPPRRAEAEANAAEVAAATRSAAGSKLDAAGMTASDAEREAHTSEVTAITVGAVEPEAKTARLTARTVRTAVEREVKTREPTAVSVGTVEQDTEVQHFFIASPKRVAKPDTPTVVADQERFDAEKRVSQRADETVGGGNAGLDAKLRPGDPAREQRKAFPERMGSSGPETASVFITRRGSRESSDLDLQNFTEQSPSRDRTAVRLTPGREEGARTKSGFENTGEKTETGPTVSDARDTCTQGANRVSDTESSDSGNREQFVQAAEYDQGVGLSNQPSVPRTSSGQGEKAESIPPQDSSDSDHHVGPSPDTETPCDDDGEEQFTGLCNEVNHTIVPARSATESTYREDSEPNPACDADTDSKTTKEGDKKSGREHTRPKIVENSKESHVEKQEKRVAHGGENCRSTDEVPQNETGEVLLVDAVAETNRACEVSGKRKGAVPEAVLTDEISQTSDPQDKDKDTVLRAVYKEGIHKTNHARDETKGGVPELSLTDEINKIHHTCDQNKGVVYESGFTDQISKASNTRDCDEAVVYEGILTNKSDKAIQICEIKDKSKYLKICEGKGKQLAKNADDILTENEECARDMTDRKCEALATGDEVRKEKSARCDDTAAVQNGNTWYDRPRKRGNVKDDENDKCSASADTGHRIKTMRMTAASWSSDERNKELEIAKTRFSNKSRPLDTAKIQRSNEESDERFNASGNSDRSSGKSDPNRQNRWNELGENVYTMNAADHALNNLRCVKSGQHRPPTPAPNDFIELRPVPLSMEYSAEDYHVDKVQAYEEFTCWGNEDSFPQEARTMNLPLRPPDLEAKSALAGVDPHLVGADNSSPGKTPATERESIKIYKASAKGRRPIYVCEISASELDTGSPCEASPAEHDPCSPDYTSASEHDHKSSHEASEIEHEPNSPGDTSAVEQDPHSPGEHLAAEQEAKIFEETSASEQQPEDRESMLATEQESNSPEAGSWSANDPEPDIFKGIFETDQVLSSPEETSKNEQGSTSPEYILTRDRDYVFKHGSEGNDANIIRHGYFRENEVKRKRKRVAKTTERSESSDLYDASTDSYDSPQDTPFPPAPSVSRPRKRPYSALVSAGLDASYHDVSGNTGGSQSRASPTPSAVTTCNDLEDPEFGEDFAPDPEALPSIHATCSPARPGPPAQKQRRPSPPVLSPVTGTLPSERAATVLTSPLHDLLPSSSRWARKRQGRRRRRRRSRKTRSRRQAPGQDDLFGDTVPGFSRRPGGETFPSHLHHWRHRRLHARTSCYGCEVCGAELTDQEDHGDHLQQPSNGQHTCRQLFPTGARLPDRQPSALPALPSTPSTDSPTPRDDLVWPCGDTPPHEPPGGPPTAGVPQTARTPKPNRTGRKHSSDARPRPFFAERAGLCAPPQGADGEGDSARSERSHWTSAPSEPPVTPDRTAEGSRLLLTSSEAGASPGRKSMRKKFPARTHCSSCPEFACASLPCRASSSSSSSSKGRFPHFPGKRGGASGRGGNKTGDRGRFSLSNDDNVLNGRQGNASSRRFVHILPKAFQGVTLKDCSVHLWRLPQDLCLNGGLTMSGELWQQQLPAELEGARSGHHDIRHLPPVPRLSSPRRVCTVNIQQMPESWQQSLLSNATVKLSPACGTSTSSPTTRPPEPSSPAFQPAATDQHAELTPQHSPQSSTTTTTTTTIIPTMTSTPPRSYSKKRAAEPIVQRPAKIYRTASEKMLPKNLAFSHAQRRRRAEERQQRARPGGANEAPPEDPRPPKPRRRRRTYTCLMCGTRFSSSSEMKIHINKHLGKPTAPPGSAGGLDACLAPSSSGSPAGGGGESSRVCHRCGFVAPSSQELARHTALHPAKTHTCQLCRLTFQTLNTLQCHLLGHGPEHGEARALERAEDQPRERPVTLRWFRMPE